jgi:hypothetical protein
MGNEAGEIWVYDSIDNNTSGAFRRIASDFDAVEVGRQSILSVADINADGFPDVVAGNKRGGVSLFSAPYPTAVKQTENEFLSFDFYPNPAKNQITLRFNNLNIGDKIISVSDALGKIVKKFTIDENIESYLLDIQDLASGFYVISFSSQKNHQSKTLLINK